jgi:hypothetical protein
VNKSSGCFTSLSHGLTLASKAQEADASLQVSEYPETAMMTLSIVTLYDSGVQASRDGTGRGAVEM